MNELTYILYRCKNPYNGVTIDEKENKLKPYKLWTYTDTGLKSRYNVSIKIASDYDKTPPYKVKAIIKLTEVE